MAERIVELLAVEWDNIGALAETLDEQQWKTPIALEGWSVQDCVSHVIGVEGSLLGDPLPDVDVSHLSYLTDPFQEIVEKPIEHRRPWKGSEVLDDYRALIARRRDQLEAMSADELDAVGWSPIGEVPYRTFMGVRLFDCWMHEQDMRRALGQPGNLSGAVVDTALDRFRQAIPFVVGKKAKAPEGSKVVIRTTGDTTLVWTIEVIDGRAKLVGQDEASAPADPTVTIDLPFTAFVALAGGRRSPDEARAAGEIALAGDTELGERILANLAFTP